MTVSSRGKRSCASRCLRAGTRSPRATARRSTWVIPSSAAHERGARGLGGRAPNPWGGVWGWPRCGPGVDGRCWSRAMSERWRSPSSMTRRDVVKGAVALAALGAGSALIGRDAAAAAPPDVGGARRRPRGDHRRRCGRRGRGLLPGRHASTSTSSRRDRKIGGHCDSHVIDYRGQRLTVDLGAQFFHPDTHPIYVTLLEQLGLYDPAHPDARRHAGGARQPVHLPDGRGPAGLLVVAPARDAAAGARFRHVHATRAAGGPV